MAILSKVTVLDETFDSRVQGGGRGNVSSRLEHVRTAHDVNRNRGGLSCLSINIASASYRLFSSEAIGEVKSRPARASLIATRRSVTKRDLTT